MKLYKVYVILCFLCLLFTSMTCDNNYNINSMTLENKSGETIYLDEFLLYDPKVLSPSVVFSSYESFHLMEIPPGGSFYGAIQLPAMGYLSTRPIKYQIIIFKKSTLDKYTKEELIENNIFDKIYSFTNEELEAIDYKVTYTGD